MASEWFRRVETIFHSALEQPIDARESFVRAEAAGDYALAERILGMLKVAALAAATTPLVARRTRHGGLPGALVGRRLGRYRLERFLGEGGFAEVYAAEQTEPLRRRVAVKVLHAAVASAGSAERLQAEAQALAAMDHPGIARIVDADEGVPEGGPASDEPRESRLYLVMELAEGEPITLFAERHQLDPAARIALVLDVAEAIQHAHQKGIIHRDLKPSNILVTKVGEANLPKVIDFGIAKALAAPPLHAVDSTQVSAPGVTQELIGTPEYMSPEQADPTRRQAVDIRTDIYSMGVVLVELLTGERPAPAETPLSARARRRFQTTSERLGLRPLRDDLDRIAARALEVDPERRYASAGVFADDLRRLLSNDAVSVGPDTITYRLRKSVVRHRLVASLAIVALLALVLGSIGLGVGLLRARSEASRADAINQFMTELLTAVNPDQRGADVTLASVLDDAAQTAAERFREQPQVEAELHTLIGTANQNLGRFKEALAEHQAAAALLGSTEGPRGPATLRARRSVVATLLSMTKHKDAEPLIAPLLEDVRAELGPRSVDAALCELFDARIDVLRGRVELAESKFRATEAWVIEAYPSDAGLRATVLGESIRLLRRVALGRGPDTEACVRLEVEVYERCVERESMEWASGGPDSPGALLARAERAKAAWARTWYSEAVEAAQSVVNAMDSRFAPCNPTRMDAIQVIGTASLSLGEVDESIRCIEAIIACEGVGLKQTLTLVSKEFNFVQRLEIARRFAELETMARQLMTSLEGMGPGGVSMLPGAELYLARALSGQGKFAEASAHFERLQVSVSASEWPNDKARLHAFLAAHHAALGRFDEAKRSLAESLVHLPEIREGTWHDSPMDRLSIFIDVHEAAGEPEKAAEYRAILADVLRENRERRRPATIAGPKTG